jgi:RNA polymerase sigma-70 factor, ECF subfamily
LTRPLVAFILRHAERFQASRVTWRPYQSLRIFFRDRTNIFERLASFFGATNFRREDPFGVDLSPTSATWREVGMGQMDATGQSPFSSVFVTLLAAARGGSAQALGVLLQSFQPYLMSIARPRLPGDLRGKYDAADLVQETLLEAHRGFAGFDGNDADDLRVWLGGILKHNLKDCIRRYRDCSKRSIGRERSLEAAHEAGDPGDGEVDPYPTPCTQSIARESVAALREALLRLPPDEQAVICLRQFDSLSFQEIGRRLGRSPEATRKLFSRAIARLQRLLEITRGSNR